MDVDILLSDEFAAFSERIRKIHERKKGLKQELRAYYDKIQEDLRLLEEEASQANREFEDWKNSLNREEA